MRIFLKNLKNSNVQNNKVKMRRYHWYMLHIHARCTVWIKSFLIAEWSGILMPFEYLTEFSPVFIPPFEYQTSEYRTIKTVLFRFFCYSDVSVIQILTVVFFIFFISVEDSTSGSQISRFFRKDLDENCHYFDPDKLFL